MTEDRALALAQKALRYAHRYQPPSEAERIEAAEAIELIDGLRDRLERWTLATRIR